MSASDLALTLLGGAVMDPVTGCWTRPTRGRIATSYTRIRDPETGRMLYAHRVIWAWRAGMPIPRRMMVLHQCDNPPCFRPDHLFLGNAKINSHDMVNKGRHFLHGNQRCRRDLHDRTPDNLYTDKAGVEWCRECMRDRQRRRRAKAKSN